MGAGAHAWGPSCCLPTLGENKLPTFEVIEHGVKTLEVLVDAACCFANSHLWSEPQ